MSNRFRRRFFGTFLFLASSALAAPIEGYHETTDFFRTVPCAVQVADTLGNWRTVDEWRAEVGPNATKAFRTRTHVVGTWVSIAQPTEKSVELSKYDPSQTTRIFYQAPVCEPRAQVQAMRSPSSAAHLPHFTDADLQSAMKDGSSGVILAWSPHMPLSLLTYPRLKRAAEKLGMKLTLVLDPFADQAEALSAARDARLDPSSLKRISSIELTGRGLGLHYPTVAVYSHGSLAKGTLKGFKEEDQFVTYLSQMRTEANR